MTTTFMYMSYLSVVILVVIYLPICLGILWLLNRCLKKSSLNSYTRKITLFLISIAMFLLPTWDAILGKYYLDKLCEKDGGTYINNQIRIEGIYFKEAPREDIAISFLQKGFDFIEMGQDGRYVRYFYSKEGSLLSVSDTLLRSKGIISYESPRTRVPPSYLNLFVANQFLEDIDSADRFGGFRNYRMYTWLDKNLEGIGSLPSTRCTDIPKFKKQNHFESQTQYLELLANIQK